MTIEKRFRCSETKDMFDEREERIRQNWPGAFGEKEPQPTFSDWESAKAFALGLLAVGFVGFLLLCVLPAHSEETLTPMKAHHILSHREVVVGERTKMPFQLPACDTPEQMLTVMSEYQEHGKDAGAARYKQFGAMMNENGERVCGSVMGFITVVEVLADTRITFTGGEKARLSVVHFTMRNGRREYYGMLVDMNVKLPGHAV